MTAPAVTDRPTQKSDWLDPIYLADLRRQMLRFAQMHLSDSALAEDAVQEALMGAMVGAHRFEGQSAIKTWVFAILKNKIADVLRVKQRTVNVGSLLNDEATTTMDDWFDNHGHWLPSAAPSQWSDPHTHLENSQFWVVFEACLDGMPAQQARVFMLREMMDFETDEISAQVGISVSNVFVILHRARLRLRECLDQRWFANTKPTP